MPVKQHAVFRNFFEMDHPLIKHKLTKLRDVSTSKKKFKELVHEITLLMAYEATSDLPLGVEMVRTPLEEFMAPVITGKKPAILPILRAGLGMVDAFLCLLPGARVGHIGMYRDEETLEPKSYFFKIPGNCQSRTVFLLDPMLATGGSAVAAVQKLKEININKIMYVSIISSPEGVTRLSQAHPDIKIFSASLDRELNKDGYILPGLGDAGDRMFGTK